MPRILGQGCPWLAWVLSAECLPVSPLPKWISTVQTRVGLGTASSRLQGCDLRGSPGAGLCLPPHRPCLEGQDRAFSRCWDKDVPVTQPCGTECIPVGGKRQAYVQRSPSPNASWDWTDVRPSAPARVLPSLACGTLGRSLGSVAIHAVSLWALWLLGRNFLL